MEDSIKTTLTMMVGDKAVREESFASLEEADAHAEQTRQYSHGITAIQYEVYYGGVTTRLGTWHKSQSGRWYYRAAEQLPE
jgi:hypothetical protein